MNNNLWKTINKYNMPQHITDTTQLKCDKGASPTPLTVTSQSFMSIDGKPHLQLHFLLQLNYFTWRCTKLFFKSK